MDARRLLGGTSALLAGCLACHEAGNLQEAPPLAVQYSGCWTVLQGPVCALAEGRTLTLWAATSEDAVLTVDGLPPEAPVPVEGGLRFELHPESTREITIEARRGAALSHWKLPVRRVDRPAWQSEARAALGAGDAEKARALAASREAAEEPGERGFALEILARLDRVEGEVEGEAERGEARLRAAIRAHRESGHAFEVIWTSADLAHRLVGEGRYGEARELLDGLEPAAGDGRGAYLLAYARGQLAGRTGDLRAAQRFLARAAAQAERLGRERDRILAEELLTVELQALGWLADADAAERFEGLLAAAEDARLTACDRAQLTNNRAWALLLACEAGRLPPGGGGDARALFHRALELFDGDCPWPAEQVNVRVNLALAHLQRGEAAEAASWLEDARRLPEPPAGSRLVWWREVEARLALEAGDPGRALALYDELAASAQLAPAAAWRAAYGRARSLEALGEPAAALEAYARAEDLLDEEILEVPMHRGRETFPAQREGATRRHLDLLLAAGRPAEALELARRSRAR